MVAVKPDRALAEWPRGPAQVERAPGLLVLFMVLRTIYHPGSNSDHRGRRLVQPMGVRLMSTERVEFSSSTGARLSAHLERPSSGTPRGWALFAHCFTCSHNVRAALQITRALSKVGIGVLRFDFTGLGESEGDFADTNLSSNVDDILAATGYMEAQLEAPSLLVGHSLGGAAVLLAASALDSVRAVATIGAPADSKHVLDHVASSREEIEAVGEATVEVGGRPFRVKKQFLNDLTATRMDSTVAGLERALLIFHSPIDEVVGIDNATHLYQVARHPKSFVSLDTADHLLSDPEDSRYVAGLLSAWADRYLDKTGEDLSDLVEKDRAVTRTERGTFFTDVVIRKHRLAADEPKSFGGEDRGPNPYEFLLAGLGSCTSMTLQMYAGRKGWPLDQAIVRLCHRRLPAPQLDTVGREIELVGDLNDEQRERLMEIADRCPVHRTLEAGVNIRSKMLE